MPEPYPLYHAESAHAWHHRSSPEIAECARAGAMTLLPVYTFTRYEPDWPLDAEEWIGGRILKQAMEADDAKAGNCAGERKSRFLVLPPLRHCPAQEDEQCFALDLKTGSRLLEDLLESVSQSGFKRMAVLHVHPLLADWLDCVLRDVRLETGLELYRIGFAGAGLDLTRDAIRSPVDACLSAKPDELTPYMKDAGTLLHSLLRQVYSHRFSQSFPQPGGAA